MAPGTTVCLWHPHLERAPHTKKLSQYSRHTSARLSSPAVPLGGHICCGGLRQTEARELSELDWCCASGSGFWSAREAYGRSGGGT